MAHNNNSLAYAALIAICIIWGTTFLAISFGIETMPPLFLAGFRQVIAGGLLTLYSYINKQEQKQLTEWKAIVITGACIALVSNSLVTWSLQFVPPGLGTLLFTSIPVWVVLLNVLTKTDRFNKFIGLGTLLGVLGMVIIFYPSITTEIHGKNHYLGALTLLAGCLFWAIGTVLNRKFSFQSSATFVSGIQLLVFGIAILGVSYASESWTDIQFSTQSVYAIAFLILFDQIIGYTCYVYALKHLSASLVSIFAYINPIVALFFSWLLRNESITWYTIGGGVCICGGVFILNKTTTTT